MRLVYVTYDEIELALLPGQVMPLFSKFAVIRSSRLLAIVSWRMLWNRKLKAKLRGRFQDQSLGIHLKLVFIPNRPFWLIRCLLWLKILSRSSSLIQARGPIAASLVPKACQSVHSKLVFDCRGVQPEEWRLANGFGKANPEKWIDRLELAEKRALQRCDAAWFVTERLKQHMQQKYAIELDHSIVIPCYSRLADQSHGSSTVSKFHYSQHKPSQMLQAIEAVCQGRRVFLFSGSFAKWQAVAQTLQAFQTIQQKDPRAFLLILSPHEQRFKAEASQFAIAESDFMVRCADPANIKDLCELADFGFLLREDHLVNRVAFPVKFAEYLACGVPLITSTGVPTCADIVEREKLGVVIDLGAENWQAELVNKLHFYMDTDHLQACKDRARNYAENHLSFTVFESRIREFYSNLLKDERRG